MTNLQPYQPGEITPTPAPAGATALVEWARAAADANTLARMLVQTAFVPKSFTDKKPIEQAANDVTAALLTGAEMGMQPMAALRSMDVIHGTPGFRAITLRGLAQSRGHRVTVLESNDTRCVVEGQRAGESTPQRSVWTIDRATKAGLTGKNPNWRSQPQNMLLARATAEVVRMIAADVVMALPYSAEELDDVEGAAPVPERAPVKRAARKKADLPPAPEPPQLDPAPVEAGPVAVDAYVPDLDDDPGGAGLMLDARSALARRMFATLNDAGVSKDDFHAECSRIVGREVVSSRDMTVDDARAVIDALSLDVKDPSDGDDEAGS